MNIRLLHVDQLASPSSNVMRSDVNLGSLGSKGYVN